MVNMIGRIALCLIAQILINIGCYVRLVGVGKHSIKEFRYIMIWINTILIVLEILYIFGVIKWEIQ